MSSSSQVITEYGKQNIFARETPPQLVENYTSYPKEAEKTNGRWAMIGITSLIGAYATTGQIIPGFFKITFNLIRLKFFHLFIVHA